MKFKFKKPSFKTPAKVSNIKNALWFKKIKVVLLAFVLIVRNFFNSYKTRRAIMWIFVAFSIIEIIFAVLIYGYGKDDKYTRAVAKVIPYPIALVNQNFISYNDYLFERDYIHHFYLSTQQTEIDLKEVDSEILNQLIDNQIILAQARLNRISITKSDIDQSFGAIVEQNGGEEKVDKVLSDLYGLDTDSFKRLMKTQMLREKVNNELIAKVSVSHILIKVDKDATEDKVLEAKTKIENIKKEIDGGLDFAEAAKKYSEDVGSAEQGGKLDAFSEGEMVQAFSDKAFETEVGTISEPVRTDFGWHIIKVEEKTGQIKKSFQDWLADLKEKSIVVKF